MELPAVPVVGLRIIEFQRPFQHLVHSHQMGPVGVGGVLHGCGHGGGFEALAHQVHLGQFAGGQLRHRIAGVGPVLDESFCGQGFQALPHGDVADAEHLGHLAHRDGRAGRYGAVEDDPAQLVDHTGMGVAVAPHHGPEQGGGMSSIGHPAIFLRRARSRAPAIFHY